MGSNTINPSDSNIHVKNSTNSDTQVEKSSNLMEKTPKNSILENNIEKDSNFSTEKESKNSYTENGSKNGSENGDEEEGECGFCLYMKGGGCKERFIAWEDCIEEAEEKSEDIVDKCFEVTSALKKCMEVHSDYYSPILQAEKAAEAEAVKTLEKEKEKEKEIDNKEKI